MSEIKITVDDIKDLMDKLSATSLGSITVEEGDFKLKISAMPKRILVSEHDAVEQGSFDGAPIGSAVSAGTASGEKTPTYDGDLVTAPIVGTYYSAPSPDHEDFVKVGDKVKKGDVLCIIESMKLMNEIQSELDGTVTEICVKGGDAIEYQQPIMVIK